jgi:UDP-N-acetylmuramoyl-tripeptide--D-alanyl-D-alanine ligase
MRIFEALAFVLAAAATAVRVAGRQHRLLHLLQLEHYEPARLLLWLRRRGELLERAEAALLGLAFVLVVVAHASVSHWLAGALALACVTVAAVGVRDWRREAVKPLVLTPRAQRLLGSALAAALAFVLAAIMLAVLGVNTVGLAVVLAIAWLELVAAPWLLLAANRALRPLESAVNARFVESARRKLVELAPLCVAVTGSYGKTTTKFCIGAVLEGDRGTLVTPESFNSYLGVVRTINERLRPEHRAFVVEMGMFRRGDIAELCELVHPEIGVLTAIGPMHLERLGSVEAIAAAKAELMEALPADGRLVVNADDPRCLEIARRAHVPVVLFGIDNPHAQVRARDISLVDGRCRFELQLWPVGESTTADLSPGSQKVPQTMTGEPVSARVTARLLGRHNVSNLLAAAAVGAALGVDPATIVAGLERVGAPEHRLQPINNRRAGVVVIDDAYNSNPEGAAAALEVLREHEASRRLLVTPGMVELGELEDELNRAFGEHAGRVCDAAILVGPRRTRPILDGLISAGMDRADVHVVRDIGEATALLAQLTRAGDVILFENDLPDTYAESVPRGEPVAGAGARAVVPRQ